MEEILESREIVDLVKNYCTTTFAKKLVAEMKFALLVGIAAAGKDSVLKILLGDADFAKIVTTITRPPRIGEINGVNYHFITDEIAKENLLARKYFEAKIVHGRVYGTTINELAKISRTKKIALADVDVQGVAEYQKFAKNLVAVFLIPPDFATWQTRWQKRGAISRDEKLRRTESAVRELTDALGKNYYRFVINDDLPRAARVCDEIFHGQQKTYKDDFARTIAEKLRDDIAKSLEK